MKYFIEQLAEYVVRTDYTDFSYSTVEKAKQVILDSYGNLVAGRYCHGIDKILTFLNFDNIPRAEKGYKTFGIENKKYTLESAVFVHTMMTRSTDLDDGYRHAMGHPGSVLVPLALTYSQWGEYSGKDLITAIIVAYDVYSRIGEVINPYMYRERGFDATGVCGAIAAAALISKLDRLNIEKTKDAMGIASLFTGGLIEYQNDGTSGKIMCSGWAALSGLRAVKLAKCGFSGPKAALEGKYGFFQAFKGTSGYCDTTKILENLGKDFKINDIYFKRHACQRGLHAILDIIIELRNKYKLTPKIIENIKINTSSFVYRLSNPLPETEVGAQASAQFTSAIALKYGKMDSEELVIKSFTDNEIKQLSSKVEIILDEEIQDYLKNNPTHFCAVKVIIKTTSGIIIEKFSAMPLGDIETPLSWEMLKNKFFSLLKTTPYEELADKKFNFIHFLNNQENLKEFFN